MSSAPVVPAPAAGGPTDILTQIRNEYQARFLAGQALIALDLQEATLASTTVAKWAADSASKGSVDPAATVTAEAAWKQANDVLKAQERSLKEMVTMLEKQIASHKATNPSDVVLVLEEQIRTLSGIRHVQEKSERETQALLKVLLAEKTQLTGPAAERKP